MTFLKDSADVTWIMGYVFIWSSVELCIAIVCACLPTIQQFLRRSFKGTDQRDYSNSYKLESEPNRSGNHVLANGERSFMWTQDDEAALTTCTANLEMDSRESLERSGSDRDDRDPSGITVTKDVQWRVKPA